MIDSSKLEAVAQPFIHSMTTLFFTAPPAYSFPDLCGSRTISIKEGASHQLLFVVTSDPALEAHAKHVLSKEGGSPRENKVYIEGSIVCFKNIRAIDAGKYFISSFNCVGLGQYSFNLKIKCRF